MRGPEKHQASRQEHPSTEQRSDDNSARDIAGEDSARDQRVERRQFTGIGFSYVPFTAPVGKTEKKSEEEVGHSGWYEDQPD
jgi:hypothetical protein